MTRNSSENRAMTMKIPVLGCIIFMTLVPTYLLSTLWRPDYFKNVLKEDVELAQHLSLPRGMAADILPIWRRYRSHRKSLLRQIVKHPDAFSLPAVLPELIVFDLDATLWWPETYRLSDSPSLALLGSLGNGIGDGVMGMQVSPNGPIVTLFPWAREVLQFIFLHPRFENVKFAAVSTSAFPSYSYLCLAIELLPGVTLGSMFDYKFIGETGDLDGPWLTNHFLKLRDQSQTPFDEIVFYDDGLWRDQVGKIYSTFGVVGQTTPSGLSMETFVLGLEKFQQSVQERNIP
eukprot:CAMPEP_0197828484 /NCGR_PEP_ID=MMETSP1437-20131217/5039_1 /TAXON_ID=49252 ORGANISM="Eucampia antarctica, Strain CCMP1452" /NCGR_SAMPLE_ID=MMETSP1437 /ASSEMBLY_ACC=CAM_ASM_001096 /LENGTH=288 /DNA_ID=CAMNT_0043429701 /DNA_START=136 /DNA_END=1002 /DNA_ORIENTATION=+